MKNEENAFINIKKGERSNNSPILHLFNSPIR